MAVPRAIADAAGMNDRLDADVVRSYWVGGPLLDQVDPAAAARSVYAAPSQVRSPAYSADLASA